MLNLLLVAVAIIAGVCLRYFEYSLHVFGGLVGSCLFVWFIVCPIAAHNVRIWPRTATVLFQSWYVVPLAMVVCSTYGTTWLAIELPGWFPDVNTAEKRIVSGVILGAVNSLLAAAWLDSAKDPNSSLWPNQRHRIALAAAFSGVNTPTQDSDLYHLVFGETTKSNDVKGWSFAARWERAKRLPSA